MMINKGQIFSLDFLISLIGVILVIGLTLNFIELHEYDLKETQLTAELKAIGEKAGDLLVSSQLIVCELYDSTETDFLGYLPNCLGKFEGNIPSGNAWGWWKNRDVKLIDMTTLGIPSGYECSISFKDIAFAVDENIVHNCTWDASGEKNVYVATRIVVAYSGGLIAGNKGDFKVEKNEFEDCIMDRPGCKFDEGKVILRVWKA